MKQVIEFAVFSGLAVVIHIALFSTAPESGAASSGAGGEALVSVQGANATVLAMVESWERPPQPVPDLDITLSPPIQAAPAPALQQFELAPAPRAAAQLTLAKPETIEPPQVDRSPPPVPKPEPRAEVKPDPGARQAEQASAGRAEQRAAGSGGKAQAGRAGGAEVATGQSGQQAKLQSIWGAKIRARIERRQRYPNGASGNGQVVVRLTVARSGQLLSHRIAKSSGNAAFDQAALRAVVRAGRFPSAPKTLDLQQLTFNLPMTFSR